jgi:hypothetical protein
MPRLASTLTLFAAIAFVTLLWLLDGTGIFLYFSYVPVMAVGVLTVGFAYLPARNVGSRFSVWGAALMVFAFAFVLPHVPTSARKRFFLASERIKPGMSLAEVRTIMEPFDTRPYRRDSVVETYRLVVDAKTVDTVVVQFAPSGAVGQSHYSAD